MTECKSCWWQEGGRCYVDDPPRNEKNQSLIMATNKCEKYWNKREALTTVIPNEALVILSEKQKVSGSNIEKTG